MWHIGPQLDSIQAAWFSSSSILTPPAILPYTTTHFVGVDFDPTCSVALSVDPQLFVVYAIALQWL
jgi:hypothetical protein